MGLGQVPEEEPSVGDGFDAPDGPDDERGLRIPVDLVLTSVVGFAVGGVADGWVFALYPPARYDNWVIAGIFVVSLLVVALLYVVVARVSGLRAGDWLVLGYATAVLAFAGFVMTREIVQIVRMHVASSIGVRSSAVGEVGWPA